MLEGADLVSQILRGAPKLHLLVTSRERLHMHSEYVFAISGLQYNVQGSSRPAPETDAVRLFMQRARRSAPGITLDGEDVARVSQICELVEGMPLAIELAASWLDLLTPAEIATEVERNVDFLAAEMADSPSRHRSIRAVFDTTWRSLDEAEQEIFARLSVFRGGFTREAAREVAGATLQQLSMLAGKSLIQPHRSGPIGHYRYEIHELLRQYAERTLSESPAAVERVRARHCDYFSDFLQNRLVTIHGAHQGRAVADISEELDNVRVAWQWAVERADVDCIRAAATSYFLYCQFQSHFVEGADAMAFAANRLSAIAPSPKRDAALAQVLNHEGWLRIRVGDLSRAVASLQESRNLYAKSHMEPPPHMGSDPAVPLAMIAQMQGDHLRSIDLAEEALHSAKTRGDAYNQAYAHYALTSAFAAQGEFDAAAVHADRAWELALDVGNRWFSAIPRNEGGRVARAAGLLDKADRYFRESHAIMAEYADREGMAVALANRGEVALERGDSSIAERFYQEALELYRGLGDRIGRATALAGLAGVAYSRNETATSCQLYYQSLAIAAEAQFLPLMLSLFVNIGDLLVAHGHAAAGLTALKVVRAHESVYYETKEQAGRALARWQDSVEEPIADAPLARANLDSTVDILLPLLTDLAKASRQP
jgi:predicted ATPase